MFPFRHLLNLMPINKQISKQTKNREHKKREYTNYSIFYNHCTPGGVTLVKLVNKRT